MELKIVKSNAFEAVKNFYDQLIDGMANAEYRPEWKKGIYPTDEFLRTSVNNHELYAVEQNGAYAAMAVINHACNAGYKNVKWGIEAPGDKVSVIHILAVLPTRQGQGIAQFLLKEAVKLCVQSGQKAIRLDVLGTNIPARRLYAKMGFQHMDTIKMFYEDTGWTDFLLYEYVL